MGEVVYRVVRSDSSRIWVWDGWQSENHLIKHFLSGAFIAIVMTGLDQDMMQKNLSCRNIRDAKKNIYFLSFSLVAVNLLFLFLGAVLIQFASHTGIAVPRLDR